jgi:hypothetical protein
MKNFDFVGRRRTLILIWVLSFLSFLAMFLLMMMFLMFYSLQIFFLKLIKNEVFFVCPKSKKIQKNSLNH